MRNTFLVSQQVRGFLEQWKPSVFSLDVETSKSGGLNYDTQELIGFSLYDGNNAVYITWLDQNEGSIILDYFRRFIIDYKGIILFHNGVFDMSVFYKYGIYFDHVELYDTLIAQHLLDENSLIGLKHLSRTILGKDVAEYDESSLDVYSEKFFRYAQDDAINTWELCEYQKPLLKEQNLLELFKNIEMPYQMVLVEMLVTGILVNQQKVVDTTKELQQAKKDVIILLHTIINEPYEIQYDLTGDYTIKSSINLNSSHDLSNILFDKLKLPIIEKTPKGVPSIGKLTLTVLKDKHEFVKTLLKYKIIQKLLTGFFLPLPKFVQKDGRVRPKFLDFGTRTGRLSSNTPNCQQLPKNNKDFPIDTRSCFIAPPGYKMIACDFSGQELRVLTEITRAPSLIQSFQQQKDLHLSTANDFFNLNIPEEALYENNKELHDEYKKKFKRERDRSKTINFGIAYGKEAFGFSKDFNITEEEAQKILDKYFGALPEVKRAIEQCHEKVKKDGWVSTLVGRRRRFVPREINDYKFYSKKNFREAFNFLIQGLSADMIRVASNKTYELAKNNPVWNLKQVMTVHDENVYIVKAQYASIVAQKIKDCFENSMQLCIPLEAEVSIGNNYGEVK